MLDFLHPQPLMKRSGVTANTDFPLQLGKMTQNRELLRSYHQASTARLTDGSAHVLTLSEDRGLCSGCCSAGWKKEKIVLHTTPADTRNVVIITIFLVATIIISQPSLPWLHPPAKR